MGNAPALPMIEPETGLAEKRMIGVLLPAFMPTNVVRRPRPYLNSPTSVGENTCVQVEPTFCCLLFCLVASPIMMSSLSKICRVYCHRAVMLSLLFGFQSNLPE